MTNRWLDERLDELRKTKADLARAMGVQPPAISKIVSGLRQVQSHEVRIIASFLEWSEAHVLALIERSRGRIEPPAGRRTATGRVRRMIQVVGVVHAGFFKEAIEIPEEDRYTIEEYVPAPFEHLNIQGFEVAGPSMNEVYPDGAIVLVVAAIQLGEGWRPKNGQRVLVQRTNAWGEVECTIKEVEWQGDEAILWPRSHDPAFKTPWKVVLPEGDGSLDEHSDKIRITGLVIRGIMPERNV